MAPLLSTTALQYWTLELPAHKRPSPISPAPVRWIACGMLLAAVCLVGITVSTSLWSAPPTQALFSASPTRTPRLVTSVPHTGPLGRGQLGRSPAHPAVNAHGSPGAILRGPGRAVSTSAGVPGVADGSAASWGWSWAGPALEACAIAVLTAAAVVAAVLCYTRGSVRFTMLATSGSCSEGMSPQVKCLPRCPLPWPNSLPPSQVPRPPRPLFHTGGGGGGVGTGEIWSGEIWHNKGVPKYFKSIFGP